jgi:hypothetical protein
MHCKFEDVQSSKVLEVDLNLDRDGSMSQSETTENQEQLSAVGRSKVE